MNVVQPRFEKLILDKDDTRSAIPEALKISLQETSRGLRALTQAKSQSTGALVLFVGGNTNSRASALKVLANAANLDMYRASLGGISGKYIGETEKNLDRLFSMVADKESILFFDEADALLGKRTELGNSHDRYANLEASSLLRRLDRFGGIGVLSINDERRLDPAFAKRFVYTVRFPEWGDKVLNCPED